MTSLDTTLRAGGMSTSVWRHAIAASTTSITLRLMLVPLILYIHLLLVVVVVIVSAALVCSTSSVP